MKTLSVAFVALLILLMAMPAGAQHRIGVIGGANLAKIDVDPEESEINYSNRSGFGAGAVLDFRLTENVALQFEPMYLQKGTELETDVENVGRVRANGEFSYIEVPAMIKLVLGNSTTPARPYVMAGPTIGFLLDAKMTNGEEVDIENITQSTDFGLGFGGGLSFPMGTSANFFVEGRYALGLTNINDDPDDPNTDVHNRGIHIMGGFTFPLGSTY